MKKGYLSIILLAAAAISLVLTTIAVRNQSQFTTQSRAQNAFVVGGLVQETGTFKPIAGATLTIGARVAQTGETKEYVVTSGQDGSYSQLVELAPGDSYFVRPGAPPAGYKGPAKTSNNSHSKAANINDNIPLGNPTYEQQVIGDRSCAETPGYASGACNFAYDLAGTPSTQPEATGAEGQGFVSFQMYVNDCTNGFSAAATYSLIPFYYHNMEIVTGIAQAGLGKGRLVGQSRNASGATFNDPHAAWEAVNGPVQFYIYTTMENTDPKVSYTIHGTDGSGKVVSKNANEPPPQPFTLNCSNQAPPLNPGEQPDPTQPNTDPNTSCGALGQACCVNQQTGVESCDAETLECR